MDLRLVLIIFILFIIFVASGDNPFEMADDNGVPKSAFKERIKERLESERSPGGPMFGGNLSGNMLGPSMQPSMPARNAPLLPNRAAPNSPAAPGLRPAPAADQPAPFRNLPAPQSSVQKRNGSIGFALNDGTPVRYAGAEVFTVDAAGNHIPMLDGKYSLNDGSIMYVRDGKQQVPPHFFRRTGNDS